MTISREEVREIMFSVKANHSKLLNCVAHQFPAQAEYGLGCKLTCTRCGGEMRLTDIATYLRGYAAAGGNPEDVLPGWGQKDV